MTGTDESTSLAFCPLRSHCAIVIECVFFPSSDYPLIGPGDSNCVSQEYRSQSLLGWKMEKFWCQTWLLVWCEENIPGFKEYWTPRCLMGWEKSCWQSSCYPEFAHKYLVLVQQSSSKKSPTLQRSSGAASQTNLQLEKPFASNRGGLRGGANIWVGVQSLKLTNNIKIYF